VASIASRVLSRFFLVPLSLSPLGKAEQSAETGLTKEKDKEERERVEATAP
jgi:hypothetical protein